METKELFNKRSTCITYSRKSYQAWHFKGESHIFYYTFPSSVFTSLKRRMQSNTRIVCGLHLSRHTLCILCASARDQRCGLPWRVNNTVAQLSATKSSIGCFILPIVLGASADCIRFSHVIWLIFHFYRDFNHSYSNISLQRRP